MVYAYVRSTEVDDDLALELAEDYLSSALCGEETRVQYAAEDLEEIMGGAFIETRGDKEFAVDSDDPAVDDEALREAVPTVMARELSTKHRRLRGD